VADNRLLIDAGAATANLPLKDQVRIDAILVSHSHLDHVRDLPLLIDNTFGKKDRPLAVWGLAETIDSLKKHVMNFTIWPDFSQLPTPENPVMTFNEFEAGTTLEIEGYEVTPILVNHPVPAVGFIVARDGAAFAYSGDTGPTDALFEAVTKDERVRCLFLDTTFPDRLGEQALREGHLTPAAAARELDKIGRNGLKVHLFHMVPPYLKEIQREIEADGRGLKLLKQGDRIAVN
jgi:ribonuclease BN (tRNA processing enzyme)